MDEITFMTDWPMGGRSVGILYESVRIKAGNGTLFLNGEKICEVQDVQFTMEKAHDEPRTLAARYRPGIYMREEPAHPVGRKEQSDHESKG